jgi:TRAP-type C4-dicarboxylate transport system permease small subunit
VELFGKIALAAVLVMLLFFLWPAFKQWQEHGPKAKGGDWQAVALPLALVVVLVVLLIAMVRG